MDKDKEFTSKNTFYYNACGLSMQPGVNRSREAKIKQEAAGRKKIGVCCNRTAEYLNRALEIGMDAGQKAIFEKWFDHSKGHTSLYAYRDPKSKGYDIGQMIDAIFDAVNEISYPHELQNHFLNCIEEDVKYEYAGSYFDYPRNKFLQMLQQRLQKPICNAIEFKTDLSELCERCPLKESIPKGIQTQIVAEAEDNRKLMPPEPFNDWINEQIKAATAVMQQMRIDSMHPAQHYPNVLTEHFIWNKERAKALQAMLSNTAQAEPGPKPLPTFEDMTDEDLTVEDLTELIKQTLVKLELLSDTGRYRGKPGQIKTLFNALEEREYLIANYSTTEAFSEYFKATFGGKVSGRTLRAALTKDQKEDLSQYKMVLPKKNTS